MSDLVLEYRIRTESFAFISAVLSSLTYWPDSDYHVLLLFTFGNIFAAGLRVNRLNA